MFHGSDISRSAGATHVLRGYNVYNRSWLENRDDEKSRCLDENHFSIYLQNKQKLKNTRQVFA